MEHLETILLTLLDMGVIEWQYGGHQKYDFAHDQIQAAANRSIPPERKRPLQVAIGRRLMEGLNSYHRDQYLFTAVQLVGAMGVQEMALSADSGHFAFWTFLAGDAALKQGAFHSALAFVIKPLRAWERNRLNGIPNCFVEPPKPPIVLGLMA